jgi:Predicted membrane protein (DUF2306)
MSQLLSKKRHSLNAATYPAQHPLGAAATRTLERAAAFWFLVAMIGQWMFVYYIAAFYSVPTLQGDFEAWKRNKMLPHGFVAGDTVGNLQFAAHVLLAGVMTLGGTLQLIPQIRAKLPALHRWTGRVFITTAILLSVGGLYMVWISARRNHLLGGLAISLDAALIIVFAVLAWRAAIARDFVAHRRWALRTFVVASGVWFMRVGYMAWLIVNQGPVGITEKSDGAFDLFWTFASFLLPLALLELYLYAKSSTGAALKFFASGVVVISAILMGIGIFGAFNLMWRPLL